MAEYTYKDVIIDPEDSRVEMGAEYYYCDNPSTCLERANKEDVAHLAVLEKVYLNAIAHFFIDDAYSICIIRKKEPSYAERQEKWIKENNIKKGDKVRVVRQAYDNEDGWDNFWAEDMDEAVGKVGTFSGIPAVPRESGIDVDVPDVGGFRYPYFVLEKVEQKYVPFDLSKEEDKARLRGAWIKLKEHSNEVMVKAIYPFFNNVSIDNEEVSTDFLLENYKFLDGTPCGKLEVE